MTTSTSIADELAALPTRPVKPDFQTDENDWTPCTLEKQCEMAEEYNKYHHGLAEYERTRLALAVRLLEQTGVCTCEVVWRENKRVVIEACDMCAALPRLKEGL